MRSPRVVLFFTVFGGLHRRHLHLDLAVMCVRSSLTIILAEFLFGSQEHCRLSALALGCSQRFPVSVVMAGGFRKLRSGINGALLAEKGPAWRPNDIFLSQL